MPPSRPETAQGPLKPQKLRKQMKTNEKKKNRQKNKNQKNRGGKIKQTIIIIIIITTITIGVSIIVNKTVIAIPASLTAHIVIACSIIIVARVAMAYLYLCHAFVS